MSQNDQLSSALSKINNAEKIGKLSCVVNTSSKIIKQVLDIFKDKGYIKSYKELITTKGNSLDVTLSGKINNCSSIKPRYPVKLKDIEKFEKRYLPAKDFGVIIVSTSKGIITHYDLKDKKIGGRLIAYCY
ncbi:MAG: 30S ribosomal protein S8 [Nanoarchaeota archaeon]